MPKKDSNKYEVTPRRLTPELVAEHRKRLGAKFNTLGRMRGPNQWVHHDRILAHSWGMGDTNPLWCDEEYALTSCYGTYVAPPSFIMSVWRGQLLHGLPGIHVMMGGNDYEFLLPLLEGDKITAECIFARIEEKRSQFADLWLVEDYDNTFTNQQDQVVVNQVCHMLRMDRDAFDSGLDKTEKVKKLPFPHPWTEEEIAELEDEQLNKRIQGAIPLFWEEVNEGDQLPDLVRGPLSITDTTAQMHSHSLSYSGRASLEYVVRRHPGTAFLHSDTRAHEHIDIIHWDIAIAKASGFPYPYDFGHSRQAWVMNAMTDWMGDHGWLKKNSAQFRKTVYLSDVIRIKSKVTRKYIDEDGEPCVDIDHTAKNQRDVDTMPCKSTVVLPSGEKDYWPVQARIARRELQAKMPKKG